jgi:hypothetical protein
MFLCRRLDRVVRCVRAGPELRDEVSNIKRCGYVQATRNPAAGTPGPS